MRLQQAQGDVTLTTPSVTTMHLLCCRGMRLLLNAPALRSLLVVDCSFNLFTPTHCSRLESLSLVVRILECLNVTPPCAALSSERTCVAVAAVLSFSA